MNLLECRSNRDDKNKLSVLQMSYLISGSAHFLNIFIFFALGFVELALINAFFSIPCYLTAFLLNRNGIHKPSFIIAILELYLHQIFATYYLGWESSFYIFLLLIGGYIFFFGHWDTKTMIMTALILFITFSLLYMSLFHGVYTLTPLLKQVFTLINGGTGIIGLSALMSYHSSMMQKAEKQLIKANAELYLNNQDLRDLNATKDKFFSIIAHDLRSPFTSILGFSELMLRKLDKKEYQKIDEYTKLINMSTKQCFSLLDNLLQWSRLQSNKIKYEPEEIKLRQLVQNVLNLLEANYEEKHIQLSVEIDPDITVNADTYMLETTIRNLLSNAIKYTHEKGKIKLAAIQEEADMKIEVKDSGVGISEENIGKLFEIENSQSTPGTNNERGTGLGLLLCKEFIEKHRGKIWVESKIDHGSSFFFTIPASGN